MVLVDTSVLIDYLKGKENRAVDKFQTVLDYNMPFGINSVIYQEVLQGVKTEKEFGKLRKYLNTHKFYRLREDRDSYANAAMIYFKCRKKGFTVNSIVDFIIAQTSIENNLLLLHNDKDFIKISKVAPLKFF